LLDSFSFVFGVRYDRYRFMPDCGPLPWIWSVHHSAEGSMRGFGAHHAIKQNDGLGRYQRNRALIGRAPHNVFRLAFVLACQNVVPRPPFPFRIGIFAGEETANAALGRVQF
jgi:hypothetical protein